MLATYQQRTRLLLVDPIFARFNDYDLADWVNTARGQLAGEAECVRVYGSLSLVVDQRSYLFSSITFGSMTGIAAVNNIRQAWFQVGSGQKTIANRPFEWFGLYHLSNPVPGSGPPEVWAQQGQGQNGTVFFDPLPDIEYVVPLDLAAAPVPLADDSTAEALPPLWQDAVPYFAAYMAMLTVGDKEGSDGMMELYQKFVQRARTAANSSVLPDNYPQQPDLTLPNKLGLQSRRSD